MSDLTAIKIDTDHIAHLLSDGLWSVPRYQRGYKWLARNVRELLNDIENAIKEKQQEYFLGTIVVASNKEGRPEIVDGQQRLATISILIAAVRDVFATTLKSPEAANGLQTEYLLKKSWKATDAEPKLRLSESDNDFFLKRILEPPSPKRNKLQPHKESHRRLLEAYQEARDYLADITKDVNKPELVLQERIDYLCESTLVILVRVPTHQNAFTIFETLNDRGLDLAITDLLKNYLFGISQDRIDEVQQKWIEMLTTVETSVNEEMIKDYLRHQWSSANGLTRERELFTEIKNKITTKKAAVDYVETLRKEAVTFAAIHNDSQDFWKGYSTSDKQHIRVITEIFGLQQRITPLLLAILSVFAKKEISASLRMITGWGARLLIAHSVAGQLEKKYTEASVKIRQGAIKTAKELWVEMKGAIPSDADFREAFATASVSKAYLARYFLHALERTADGEKEPELVSNEDETELNLEHILPQNREPGTWKLFDEENHERYRFKLGNLALMKATENGNVATDEFVEKKPAYAQSRLTLTREIAIQAKWTPKTIEARQARLADLAVKTWTGRA